MSVKKLIGVGIDEGATLVTGGVESFGRNQGLFCKPTIFANVNKLPVIAQRGDLWPGSSHRL
ncbi:MAG: aldehyde dehydrogenase family protein [Sphingomonadales bacterium]|nr:aldehyde dehydrogenase family protein [Sphingomonadales bacterium]